MSNDQEKNPRARMVQYGVWANCSNQCDFCLRKERIPYPKQKQLDMVNKIRENINYIDWENEFSSGISLLGGELYYITDPELQSAFLELIDDIIEKILKKSKNPRVRYSSVTNGIYEPTFLYKVVDKIKDAVGIEKVDMNFSYDLKYRYHDENTAKLVLKNINDFHNRYQYKVNVQMILTQYLINLWKEGKFDYNEFIEENIPGNSLTFLYPHAIHTGNRLDDFFFKRSDFLEFVSYLKEANSFGYVSFILSTFNSARFKYTGLRDRDENKVVKDIKAKPILADGKEEINIECGHSTLYRCYSDSDKCMLCDLYALDDEGYLSIEEK